MKTITTSTSSVRRTRRASTRVESASGGVVGVAVVVILCLVLPLPCSSVISPPININLKPAFLKDLLTRESSSSSSPAKSSSNKVSVDLSGRYECLVRGRGHRDSDDDDNDTPLIVASHPPDVRIGLTYDIRSTPWWKTVFAKLQWRHVDWHIALEQHANHNNNHNNNDNNDNNHHHDTQYTAASTYIEIKPNPMVQFQVGGTTKKKGHVLARLIPHNRLSMEYKAHLNEQLRPSDELVSTPRNDPEWWIPNMQISTTGRLESRNSYRLQNGGSISLYWSRSLGWFDQFHASSTTTNLQLTMTQRWSAHHVTDTTIRGNLNDLRGTTRLTVAHQQFLPRIGLTTM